MLCGGQGEARANSRAWRVETIACAARHSAANREAGETDARLIHPGHTTGYDGTNSQLALTANVRSAPRVDTVNRAVVRMSPAHLAPEPQPERSRRQVLPRGDRSAAMQGARRGRVGPPAHPGSRRRLSP